MYNNSWNGKTILNIDWKGMLSMVSKKSFWLVVGVAVIVAVITFFTVYNIYIVRPEDEIENVDNSVDILKEESVKEVVAVEKERVNEYTDIVYEYYYMGDGEIKTLKQEPSYYMIGMTREDIEKNYPTWHLQAFSEDEVILRKNLEHSSQQRYTISVYKGYVAVFVEENGKTMLKELTNTPVAALTTEEQYRLELGIGIVGEEALISALEDYES